MSIEKYGFSDQIGILCDYINQYRTLMQQTAHHIYDREMGAENIALTLKALPQRKEAVLSLYCACETLKAILREGARATRHDSEDAAQTGRKIGERESRMPEPAK